MRIVESIRLRLRAWLLLPEAALQPGPVPEVPVPDEPEPDEDEHHAISELIVKVAILARRIGLCETSRTLIIDMDQKFDALAARLGIVVVADPLTPGRAIVELCKDDSFVADARDCAQASVIGDQLSVVQRQLLTLQLGLAKRLRGQFETLNGR